MTKTTDWLIEIFRAMSDPSNDPEAALRGQLRRFMHSYLEYKGTAGGTLEEGYEFLVCVLKDDPLHLGCPVSLPRIEELWRQTFLTPSRLPSLNPPAQLAWLGTELDCPLEAIDAALSRLFRMEPYHMAQPYRDAAAHFSWQADQLRRSAQVH